MTKMLCLSVASVLLFSVQQASAELTVGLDLFQDSGDRDMSTSYSSSGNEFDSSNFTADSSGYRLRFAFASIKENRAELYFSQYDVDDNGQFNDKEEWEIGVNYIVTFLKQHTNPSLDAIIPFLKVGLGIGQADTDMKFITGFGDTTDNINNIHLNFGGGISYSFTDNIAVTGSIEYIYRNWEDIGNDFVTIDTTDSVFRVGIGIDVSF